MRWEHIEHIEFREPAYLWLLIVAALLLLVLLYRAASWRYTIHVLRRRRVVPVHEGFARFGPWPFWLCLAVALALCVVALARPERRVARPRMAGVDLIVLQDGSASMHVRDVGMTRWQRSMRFLRTLTETLDWTDDRVALALFARIAAPQIRLTRDPNTVFFFLDHLRDESPFPLRDVTTWDTNIELGIDWGRRLLDRDEQLNGPSPNAKAFVLVSDGQAWSGNVAAAVDRIRSRNIPIFVVGVGTAAGGAIPEPPPDPFDPLPPRAGPLRASLDRTGLESIAAAGRGVYFDLARNGDVDVATAVVGSARRRAGSRGIQTAREELYWWFLLGAAAIVCVGASLMRDLPEAAWQAVAAAISVTAVWAVLT